MNDDKPREWDIMLTFNDNHTTNPKQSDKMVTVVSKSAYDKVTAERDALKSIMEREGLKGMANASLHIELDELKAKLAPLVEALEVVMHDNRGKNFEMAQSVLKEFKK